MEVRWDILHPGVVRMLVRVGKPVVPRDDISLEVDHSSLVEKVADILEDQGELRIGGNAASIFPLVVHQLDSPLEQHQTRKAPVGLFRFKKIQDWSLTSKEEIEGRAVGCELDQYWSVL